MELTTKKRQKLLRSIEINKNESEYIINNHVFPDSLNDDDLEQLNKIYEDLWYFLYKRKK
jgi:hypothetical protein